MRSALALSLFCSSICLAERGDVEAKFSLGWTGFLDDSNQNHLLVGGSGRYYFTRRASVEAEVQYLHLNRFHHDWVLLPSVNYDLGTGRFVPYFTVGFGLMRSVEDRFSNTGAYLSGGFGTKVYIVDRWFVAPEFRIGLEPHARFSVGLGYTWRK